MFGFFSRFFAPAWRHPDPKRRRKAIDDLDSEQNRAALEHLLDDSATQVRDAALLKLDDPERFIERLEHQQNDVIQARLIKHLNGSAAGALSLETRQKLLETLSEPALLKTVAFNADNQQLRLTALERLRDESDLIEQACHNKVAAVRHAAAQRVESNQGLEQLIKLSTRDRNIVRLARNRLNERQQNARELKARHEQREYCIGLIEKLARGSWEPQYEARHRHVLREWDQLASEADADQSARFKAAHHQCEETIRAHYNAQLAAEEKSRAETEEREARTATIEALDNALDHLKREPHPRRQDIDSLLALRRLQAERWINLSEDNAPAPSVQARYLERLATIDSLVNTWQTLDEHRTQIEQALDQSDMDALATHRQAIDWPREYPLPLLLQEVDTALATHAAPNTDTASDDEARAESEHIAKQAEQLEQLIESGELQSATRLFDALQARHAKLDAQFQKKHAAHIKRLKARIAELRDWRSFVAAPKREHLCQAMEELAHSDEAETNREQRHRQLVSEWKQLGSAAASRELSQRFRSASDQVRKNLEGYYQHLDQQRTLNKQYCEALCNQLEQLIDNADQLADPDALRTIRNKAREEWRTYSPLPREHVATLRHRFGLALQGVQTLIDQKARGIAEQKQALVEEAEQLLTDERDIEQRTRIAKDLQKQWRSLGRAPKGDEQRLWKQFRSVCDRLFEWRDNERTTRKGAQDQQLDALQALIDRVDQWHPTRLEDSAYLDQVEQELEEYQPLPRGRRSEGMLKRWNGIVRRRREELDSLANDELKQRWHAWQPLLEAHVEADEARMQGDTFEDVASLTLEPPLTKQAQRAHQARNLNRRHGTPTEDDTLQRLKVHLALMANAPISADDNDRRLDIQVARLNDNVGQEYQLSDEFSQWLCQLIATGPVTRTQWARLKSELDQLVTQLDFHQ
ncbi:DUF349 domain-containing protein [Larsenimonas salina]|uniref:DUF349 domain-containing protein n=1 Tax=Larsenimonas salina TaxID=1295565 RepID=UPI0020743D2C|nr:DUF349 domain-containing protein [Larsenimonas salina]MCM5705561.1 DUF349 domain-containing protein [Larsenimonas salina]